MMLIRQLLVTSVVTASVMLPVGGALADSVSVSGATGPDSSQTVNANSSSQVVETNVSNVVITGSNTQQATTGDVAAQDNTSVGGITSGGAFNGSSATSQVVVANNPDTAGDTNVVAPPVSTPVVVVSPASNDTRVGSVLGSAIAGGMGAAQAVLPAVGPTSPVDVSAIRSSWNAPAAQAVTVVSAARPISLGLFALALSLSVAGGIGNAAYLRRKEGRI